MIYKQKDRVMKPSMHLVSTYPIKWGYVSGQGVIAAVDNIGDSNGIVTNARIKSNIFVNARSSFCDNFLPLALKVLSGFSSFLILQK